MCQGWKKTWFKKILGLIIFCTKGEHESTTPETDGLSKDRTGILLKTNPVSEEHHVKNNNKID